MREAQSNLEIMLQFFGQQGGIANHVSSEFNTDINPDLWINPVKLSSVEELTGFGLWNEDIRMRRVYCGATKEHAKTISSIINAYKKGAR